MMFDAYKADFLKRARSLPVPIGRPSLFDSPLPSWQRMRRSRERLKGQCDPVLFKIGRSVFQD